MPFPDALSNVVDAPTGTETLGGSTPTHTVHTQALVDAVNETQAATLYRARADELVFDAVAYGAAVDGSTDDTAAWQAAINACGAAGGGVVTCSRAGVSVIAGALQDTAGANAQLLLPDVHMLNDPQMGMEIRGPWAQSACSSVVGAAVTPTTGLILKSTLAAGSGAVLGAYGSGTSYQNFTFVNVTLRNLTVRTVANPTITGIDFRHANQCTLENVIVDTGQYDTTLTEPTTATSFGLRLPTLNNGANINLRDVSVFGFYNGIEHSEHANFDNVAVGGVKVAITATAANHSSYYGRMLCAYYQTGLKFTGSHYLDVEQWAVEHASSGWYVTTSDVSDASNYGHGTITWAAVLQGVGPHNSFTVSGGANLNTYRVGEVPAGGGGAAATYTYRDHLTAAAGDAVLTLGASPVTNSPLVWVNGAVKWPAVDYIIADNVITFDVALTGGEVVDAYYVSAASTAGAATLTPPATVNIQDDFNRANSTTVLGVTSVGGKTWTQHSGTWGIASNQAYLSSNTAASCHASIDAAANDVTVAATIYPTGTGTSRYAGVSGRLDATGQNGYMVQVNGPAANISLLKLTGGSTTPIGATVSYSPTAGDRLELVMSGSTLTVKVNASTLLTRTDSTYAANTRHGLWTYTDQMRFDDFSVAG